MSGSGSKANSGRATSHNFARTDSLPASLRTSSSLANIDLYVAPYEQHGSHFSVDQVASELGELSVYDHHGSNGSVSVSIELSLSALPCMMLIRRHTRVLLIKVGRSDGAKMNTPRARQVTVQTDRSRQLVPPPIETRFRGRRTLTTLRPPNTKHHTRLLPRRCTMGLPRLKPGVLRGIVCHHRPRALYPSQHRHHPGSPNFRSRRPIPQCSCPM